MYITLTPAYNRDYKSKAAVLQDWLAGKDFIIETAGVPYSGKPMNASQADEDAYNIRYAALRKVCVIRRSGDTWVIG